MYFCRIQCGSAYIFFLSEPLAVFPLDYMYGQRINERKSARMIAKYDIVQEARSVTHTSTLTTCRFIIVVLLIFAVWIKQLRWSK